MSKKILNVQYYNSEISDFESCNIKTDAEAVFLSDGTNVEDKIGSLSSSPGDSAIVVSETAPANPFDGQIWMEIVTS